jgi:hypothetical protein
MSEQPLQDVNDGKRWSEMDLFDLRNSLAYGRSIEMVAGFLHSRGSEAQGRRIGTPAVQVRLARRGNGQRLLALETRLSKPPIWPMERRRFRCAC